MVSKRLSFFAMGEPAIRYGTLSVEAYLELEKTASVRHEYVAGQLYALAGGTARHNQIAGNIFARLKATAQGDACRIYTSDLKVRAADDLLYYPDVMVVCEDHDPDALEIAKPCLLVEVTSPSTETIDRREKLAAYTRVPTLKGYLIVHQSVRRVERYWRTAEGTWESGDVVGEGRVPLRCLELTLTLDDIYEGVSLAESG